MTTGRINQVTIFEGRRSQERPRPPAQGGLEFSSWEGCKHPAAALCHKMNCSHSRLTAIRLPPLGSPKRSPSKKAVGTQPDLDISASEGGSPSPVTSLSKEGRLPVHGCTPDCVVELIAIGQQSTDSFGAPQLAINRSGFGRFN